MKSNLILIALFVLIASANVKAQNPEIIKLADFKQLLSPKSDTTYVINFWATWCKPCIEELPVFEKYGTDTKNRKVKVILVSLDFVKHIDKQLKPFLKKNNIQSTVLLLNEPDANQWIDLVDPSWSGAIPATLLINSSKKYRKFYQKEFNYKDLDYIVKPAITQ